MPVTSFLNQKGGVGKTSCCHHLAGAFVQMGRRVLLLDNDPQASLTQGLIGPEETLALLPEATLAAVLAGDAPFPEQIIRKVCPGIDLIPGSDALEFYDNYPPERESLESQCCLRDFLAEIRDRYDHILIDCRPAVRLCSWRALAAADSLVIPLQAEDYGAQGVPKMLDSVNMVRAAVNPDLRHGFVITMNNPRKSIQKVYEDTVRLTYGVL